VGINNSDEMIRPSGNRRSERGFWPRLFG